MKTKRDNQLRKDRNERGRDNIANLTNQYIKIILTDQYIEKVKIKKISVERAFIIVTSDYPAAEQKHSK